MARWWSIAFQERLPASGNRPQYGLSGYALAEQEAGVRERTSIQGYGGCEKKREYLKFAKIIVKKCSRGTSVGILEPRFLSHEFRSNILTAPYGRGTRPPLLALVGAGLVAAMASGAGKLGRNAS